MRRNRERQEEDADIYITPKQDIVFIMLIFFIVTATFVKESGIDVTRPDAETAVKQNRVAILIAIRDNNEVWINRRQVDLASVRANVEKLHAENPHGGAVIQSDREDETGVLVEIRDQVRLAGVGAISIAAEENKAGTGNGNDRIFQNDGRCADGRRGHDRPVSHHESAGDGSGIRNRRGVGFHRHRLCVSSATKKARPRIVHSNVPARLNPKSRRRRPADHNPTAPMSTKRQ